MKLHLRDPCKTGSLCRIKTTNLTDDPKKMTCKKCVNLCDTYWSSTYPTATSTPLDAETVYNDALAAFGAYAGDKTLVSWEAWKKATLTEEALKLVENRIKSGMVSPDEWRKAIGLSGDICNNCQRPIQVQIFKGLGWCSDDCRKALGKDIE